MFRSLIAIRRLFASNHSEIQPRSMQKVISGASTSLKRSLYRWESLIMPKDSWEKSCTLNFLLSGNLWNQQILLWLLKAWRLLLMWSVQWLEASRPATPSWKLILLWSTKKQKTPGLLKSNVIKSPKGCWTQMSTKSSWKSDRA